MDMEKAISIYEKMAKAGEDISWRKMMSDNRKEIGDFACFLHCIIRIEAR